MELSYNLILHRTETHIPSYPCINATSPYIPLHSHYVQYIYPHKFKLLTHPQRDYGIITSLNPGIEVALNPFFDFDLGDIPCSGTLWPVPVAVLKGH
jgi:hypothetical protein